VCYHTIAKWFNKKGGGNSIPKGADHGEDQSSMRLASVEGGCLPGRGGQGGICTLNETNREATSLSEEGNKKIKETGGGSAEGYSVEKLESVTGGGSKFTAGNQQSAK